uniref:Uncharacterized protein n=1 Tax=Bracon brevicornis TaxID=1563983 RepID=A0A6V7KH30_9HYME
MHNPIHLAEHLFNVLFGEIQNLLLLFPWRNHQLVRRKHGFYRGVAFARKTIHAQHFNGINKLRLLDAQRYPAVRRRLLIRINVVVHQNRQHLVGITLRQTVIELNTTPRQHESQYCHAQTAEGVHVILASLLTVCAAEPAIFAPRSTPTLNVKIFACRCNICSGDKVSTAPDAVPAYNMFLKVCAA